MKKVLSNIFFTICIIGMIFGLIPMLIQTGGFYITVFTKLGLIGMLSYLGIGIVFYGLILYGFYRLDLKVRKIIRNESEVK